MGGKSDMKLPTFDSNDLFTNAFNQCYCIMYIEL